YIGLRVLLDGHWAPIRARWREWLVFGVVAAIALAPLGVYAVTNPTDFLRRQAKLSPLNAEQAEGQHPVARFTEALVGTLPMFTLRGDERALRNLPGRPVFDLLIAPFFVIGLGLALWRFRQPAYSFALLWFGVTFVASAAPLGLVPHYSHAFVMLPVLFLFPAIGLVDTATLLTRRGLHRPVVAGVAGALVAGSVGWAWHDYFRVYPTLPELYFQYDADVVDTVNQMNDRGHDPRVAFVVAVGKLYPERYQHGTFSFLYKGAAPWRFVRVDEATVARDVAAAVGDKRTVVRFERTVERETPPDNKDVVDFLLQRQGRRISDEFYRGFRVTAYTVDGPIWPTVAPGGERPAPAARFGDVLRLTTWAAGPSADRGAVWAVARWQALAPMPVAYKASLRLRDSDGAIVALADRDLLRAPFFESTVDWEVGDTEASYHLLRLPVGLPPGDYTLTALVYDAETGKPLPVNGGVELALGAVTLDTLAPGALDPAIAIPPRSFGPVALVGRTTPNVAIPAGGVAPVTLYWQATAPPTNATVQVRLVDAEGATVARWTGVPLAGRFPPDRWPLSAIVQQTIRLPVDAAATGATRLEVQWGDHDPQVVGVATVAGRARQYVAPPIARPINAPVGEFGTLLGWNPGPAAPGAIALELIWQATARVDRSWTVFVHLVGPDGRIVAQVDRVPAGDSPTTSWLPGEIVIDRVTLAAPPGGPYRVRVGMYDARTGVRVAIGAGDQVEFAVAE
ncbi:MAG: hypothetical protein NZ518_05275, partial [Dehalococcoidia bacterium]|nr:hypothetical protein [Dehalococcoidia bacterium]